MLDIMNETVEADTLVSFGSGSGSRASQAAGRGRAGGRNIGRGSATRLRNQVAAAQGANRGRGSRARRAALAGLATRAAGNARGNVNARNAAAVRRELAALNRQIRALGG